NTCLAVGKMAWTSRTQLAADIATTSYNVLDANFARLVVCGGDGSHARSGGAGTDWVEPGGAHPPRRHPRPVGRLRMADVSIPRPGLAAAPASRSGSVR